MIDNIGRKINYLRISVTDRCNLRCTYCMPKEGIKLISHDEILSFHEILRIVKCCSKLGIENIRLTGGEPLIRKGITKLIKDIKNVPGIKEVSITTNGIILKDCIDELIEAGLDRINISLDTLNRDKFKKITGVDGYDNVKEGILRALEKNIRHVKLNVVIMKEVNFTEIMDFVKLAEEKPIHIRFIELMPIGLGSNLIGVKNDTIKSIIENQRELIPFDEVKGLGPASYFKTVNSKGSIGFISPISHKFCAQCNRIRLTSEGFLKLCLHWNTGVNLKEKLRLGIDDEELKNIINKAIKNKPYKHDFKVDKKNMKQKNIKQKNYDLRGMFQIGG